MSYKVVIGFFLLLLLVFGISGKVLAATGVLVGRPNECCKLKRDFTEVDENCKAGAVVGSPDPKAWCDWNNDGKIDEPDAPTIRWGTCCFLNSLYNISDWLFWLVFPLTVLVGLVAGYHFLTSAGNPEKIKTAQNFIFWAIIGALVVGLAKALVAIIKVVVG